MRALFVLVPAALVGAYLAGSTRSQSDEPTARHAGPVVDADGPTVVAATAPTGPQAVRLLPPRAAREAPSSRLSAVVADAHTHGTIHVRGGAKAALSISLDGLLEVLEHQLDERVGPQGEIRLEGVSISGSLLADLAAHVDGYLEVETEDGKRVLLTARDLAAAASQR